MSVHTNSMPSLSDTPRSYLLHGIPFWEYYVSPSCEQQGNNTSITVLEEVELHRFHTRVEYNDTWLETYPIESTMTGENLRFTFLLYKGDPPANPSVENAYRKVHLWVNVEEGEIIVRREAPRGQVVRATLGVSSSRERAAFPTPSEPKIREVRHHRRCCEKSTGAFLLRNHERANRTIPRHSPCIPVDTPLVSLVSACPY